MPATTRPPRAPCWAALPACGPWARSACLRTLGALGQSCSGCSRVFNSVQGVQGSSHLLAWREESQSLLGHLRAARVTVRHCLAGLGSRGKGNREVNSHRRADRPGWWTCLPAGPASRHSCSLVSWACAGQASETGGQAVRQSSRSLLQASHQRGLREQSTHGRVMLLLCWRAARATRHQGSVASVDTTACQCSCPCWQRARSDVPLSQGAPPACHLPLARGS